MTLLEGEGLLLPDTLAMAHQLTQETAAKLTALGALKSVAEPRMAAGGMGIDSQTGSGQPMS